MQTISSIIDQLAISESPLSTPLLGTKILASRIKNNDLLQWVNNEIEGYEDANKVPLYRIAPCNLQGSYVNGNVKVTDTALPIPDISDKITKYLTSTRITQSCSALEYLLSAGDKSGQISYKLSGDVLQFLQRKYSEQNPFMGLYSATLVTSVSVFYDILASTRSKLLDLMLKLESEYGNNPTIAQLSSGNPMINNFVQNIYNTGNNNVINTGDNSSLTSIS
ncbi:hypothetical protein [Chitinophaga eiseniae]|uniref:AbiTii domain-containing protein n=1 Tax=Chitinophaga eiseniae TaxID=634771 RepID=A0A847SI70_9BACT|nr:hypothetical protein [Chitinophaga eiseniae]NLR83040.1 hypothetical protein [Chitinophaga eiseniae]